MLNPISIDRIKKWYRGGWSHFCHKPAWQTIALSVSLIMNPLMGGSGYSHGILSPDKTLIAVNAIYRRYETPLVRLQNIGSEMKGVFGYYKQKWFVAAEIGFDKAVVTHFKHSQFSRKTSFKRYKMAGLNLPPEEISFTAYRQVISFSNCDLTFSIGKTTTQDFMTAPIIPYYLGLGFNYKLDEWLEVEQLTKRVVLVFVLK